ncbi:beta-carotene 15,15'-monooxygenase [Ureibacillus sp. MALMAid1270]|uniref:beta-carotene 15,15'-monooxygenase n=1 Tax=Ureibacillus sp. MALMAid1270 TaxID=3411629 RepID=UPI003BA6ACB3
MTISKLKGNNIWLVLLGLVLASNFVLYKTQFGAMILTEETNPVVIGSLIDFIIIAPTLFMLYKKKFSWKMAIGLIATGCIAAKLIIPANYLQPFDTITWTGIALEAAIFILELSLIISFVRYMPKIKNAVRNSSLPKVFSFPQAVDQYVSKNPLIFAICSEVLVFYYSLLSWKKKPVEGITIYKNSSFMAFQIMLIHATVLETIGVHWLFHYIEINPVVSIIMLVLNIYTVLFLLADIQALRLNPVFFNEESVYLSQGLMKRIKIEFENIEALIVDPEVLQSKLSKDTLDFVARDFETVYPDIIIKLRKPVKGTHLMGLEKQYTQVAVRTDSPNEFLEKLQKGIDRNNLN